MKAQDGKWLDEVVRIRGEACRMLLAGCGKLMVRPIDQLATIYNGTGPEFLPGDIRGALDRIASPFLPAVMIHDNDFEDSDGSVIGFHEANKRLLANCFDCATDAAQWYNWKRYVMYAEAWAIYRACEKFGWIAWLSSYVKNKKQIKE